MKFLYINILNKRYKLLSFFLTLLLGWSSIGWIDPMADKIREGNRLYQDGNYDGALDKYVNAQIDSPEIPQLDFNIADVQYKRGKYSEAAQLFEKVIKSDDIGMKTQSSFNLGNTRYRQGKMKEALECYKKTVDYINEAAPTPSELDALKNDAKYNYEYVEKKMKEQQQKQQKQDQKDQQQKEGPDKKDEQSGEKKGEDKEKQESQKDKQQPTPENTQEKNENKEDENHSQSDKDKQKDQPEEQQQRRPQEMKQMSKEEAERLLDALNQSEKEARAMVRDTQHFQHKSVEKDW
ncbi:MAG: tetratricopeptide repeat protein [Candidatus Brocadiaceae bacterium]|nr:tetratricopeptide repeat protein [Candidatus Brocadiaceae bacterium]